ncbi:MAG: hypothetical protein AB3N14_18155 [Flavobacteriaceae bacterium]
MKTKAVLLLLLAVSFNFTYAQVTQSTGQLASKATTCGDMDALFTLSGKSIHNLMYADVNANASNTSVTNLQSIKGSPYLAETFSKAKVFYDDKLLGTLYARYNAYSKEIEIKRTNLEEEEYKALTKDEKLKVVFANSQMQYASFIDGKGKRQNEYLISLSDGSNYSLYQRYMVNYVEGKKAENSMVNDIPSRFTNSVEYYLKDMNTSLVSNIPTKKSKLIALFKGSDEIQLANLIKKNSLNVKKEGDLIKLFELANSVSDGYVAKE